MYTDVFMTMLDKQLIDKGRPWSLCFARAKICRKHIFRKYSKIIKAFPADTQNADMVFSFKNKTRKPVERTSL